MAEQGSSAKKIQKNVSKQNPSMLSLFQYTQLSLLQVVYMQADSIRWLRKIIAAAFIAIVILAIGMTISSQKQAPIERYFVVEQDGTIREIKPLSESPVNMTELRVWAEACLVEATELSFINPVRKINTVLNRCFTQNGKLAYQDWLIAGNSTEVVMISKGNQVRADSEIGEVVSKKISISTSPKAPGRILPMDPIVNDEGEAVMRWQLSVPLLLRKQEGGVNAGTGSATAVVVLVRTNNTAFPKGAAIDSFVLRKDKS
ncbi:DotI/IcmL/TraM family protein [Vibrio mediterranei]|uniref:DotI/IcmL/TraM family protein n=1 Tax=Vibrio mediterranei TaxID=689 RepID=UPI0038CE4223